MSETTKDDAVNFMWNVMRDGDCDIDEDAEVCACGHTLRYHCGRAFNYRCELTGCGCTAFRAATTEGGTTT